MKILIFCLLSLNSCLIKANFQSGDTLYNWNYLGAYLRNDPTLNSKILCKIPFGKFIILDSITIAKSNIKILDTGNYNKIQLVYNERWYRIKYDSISGYVNKINFLKLEPDSTFKDGFEYFLYKNRSSDIFDTICIQNKFKDYKNCLFKPRLLNNYRYKYTSGEFFDIELFIPNIDLYEVFTIIKFYTQKFAIKDNSNLQDLISVWKSTDKNLNFDIEGTCHYFLLKVKEGVKISYYCAC
jgi:hypothetical protein